MIFGGWQTPRGGLRRESRNSAVSTSWSTLSGRSGTAGRSIFRTTIGSTASMPCSANSSISAGRPVAILSHQGVGWQSCLDIVGQRPRRRPVSCPVRGSQGRAHVAHPVSRHRVGTGRNPGEQRRARSSCHAARRGSTGRALTRRLASAESCSARSHGGTGRDRQGRRVPLLGSCELCHRSNRHVVDGGATAEFALGADGS